MERCLKKLVLEAETTGFQDPARTARSLQREELCWKGSVGGQWVYTHECRRAKKLIPACISLTLPYGCSTAMVTVMLGDAILDDHQRDCPGRGHHVDLPEVGALRDSPHRPGWIIGKR